MRGRLAFYKIVRGYQFRIVFLFELVDTLESINI
jgi:hypothetical protein